MRLSSSACILGALLAVAVVAACSGDEADGPGTPDAGENDTRDGALATDASTDPIGDAGPADGAGVDGGSRGIKVTVGETTRTLTEGAKAALAGNGYSIQAAQIDGTQMWGVTILLVKAESNGGAPSYVEPTPGSYACVTGVPSPPYLWARIQYSSPDGIFQYGNPGNCVELTQFGGIGEPVAGTFAATLARVTGTGEPELSISGTFDIDRTN